MFDENGVSPVALSRLEQLHWEDTVPYFDVYINKGAHDTRRLATIVKSTSFVEV